MVIGFLEKLRLQSPPNFRFSLYFSLFIEMLIVRLVYDRLGPQPLETSQVGTPTFTPCGAADLGSESAQSLGQCARY